MFSTLFLGLLIAGCALALFAIGRQEKTRRSCWRPDRRQISATANASSITSTPGTARTASSNARRSSVEATGPLIRTRPSVTEIFKAGP